MMSEILQLAVVTAGSSQSSSTRLLADRAAEATVKAARERGWEVEARHIDVRQLAGEVSSALISGISGERLTRAVETLGDADGLIVGTPVYNAGPSGLFTSFFQAIDDDLLIAKPVMLTATAASARHALVVDDQMRPMFAYLRTLTVPSSLFAASEDWNDRDLSTRIERAATELALLMGSGFAREVRESTWGSYRHEFGSAASSDDTLDFDSEMMKLAAGGSLAPSEPDGDEPATTDEGKGEFRSRD
jgi:FMN reductase